MVGPHYSGMPVDRDGNGDTIVSASKLNIVWGEDSRYWKKPANNEDPAELLQVCWLEVTGNVAKVKQEKEYEVIFKVSLTADAFGWATHPIYTMVKRGGRTKWGKMSLANKPTDEEFDISIKLPKDSGTSSQETLTFGLYEVWSGKWKGGLKIHRVVVKEY